MFFALVVVCRCGAVELTVTPPAQKSKHNLARGVSYQAEPAPNYWGWKNPRHGDHGQLTDGRTVSSWSSDSGPFYTLRSSMGWSNKSPVLVFDLGTECLVTGIGIHSVLSPWGPWWPERITLLVSNNNRDFYLAGPEVIVVPGKLEPPLSDQIVKQAVDRVLIQKGQSPSTHWLRHDGWKVRGRYVALVLGLPPATGAIVVDEIEIYGKAATGKAVARPERVFSEGRGGVQSYRLDRALNERLTRDAAGLEHKIAEATIRPQDRQSLQQQLRQWRVRQRQMPVTATAEFRAIFPVNPLHAELFALQATLWRLEGAPVLRLWQTHRWDPLGPLSEPLDCPVNLDLTMAANTKRNQVLNLSNAHEDIAEVRLKIEGLPEGVVEVEQVLLVDTHAFEPVASAIIAAEREGDVYQVKVEPGMTRQVWLRFSARSSAPGFYRGAVRLSSQVGEKWSTSVAVSLEILPVVLPDTTSLYVGGWDYPWPNTYQVTAANVSSYLSLLHEYGVNTAWADNVLGVGEFDDQGRLVKPPSRTRVDQWLQKWPDASLYCAVIGPVLPLDAPLRDQKIQAWARDWSDYLQQRGVPPNRVAMLIVDEPTSADELSVILHTGRSIQQGEPQFKIFNDLHFADLQKAPPLLQEVLREACDIQCFNTRHYLQSFPMTRTFMQQQSRDGLEWWTYTGGGSHRLTDPYVAWLLRFWFCFDQGLTGAHFWSFGDGNGGFSWNEYFGAGPTRSPFYLSPGDITVSKSLEAMREGMQDYALLQMLEAMGQRQADKHQVFLLRQNVRRVLKVHTQENWLWKQPKDRSLADTVRVEVLRALALSAGK